MRSSLGKGNCRGMYPTTSEFKYAQLRELVIGAPQSLHTELNQVQLCMTHVRVKLNEIVYHTQDSTVKPLLADTLNNGQLHYSRKTTVKPLNNEHL